MMIPVGYMAKKVSGRPDWLKAEQVSDIYSVSGCISEDFDDYINYWQHNGYWLFNAPQIIDQLAATHHLDIGDTCLFFYEAYELQYDQHQGEWQPYFPEESFDTNVLIPQQKYLQGYDVVSFSGGTSPECSVLSCNHMAEELKVNRHCLFETFEEARSCVENGVFKDCEPGPYRIFAVYRLKTMGGSDSALA